MFPLSFPVEAAATWCCPACLVRYVVGQSGDLPFFLGLPTVHTVHGWSSRRRSLALVTRCCQQMTEYMVCVLPPRAAIQAPSLHGPGCWRKLLLRCFEYKNPSVSSWGGPPRPVGSQVGQGLPSLPGGPWCPSSSSCPESTPCLVTLGCAAGIPSSRLG